MKLAMRAPVMTLLAVLAVVSCTSDQPAGTTPFEPDARTRIEASTAGSYTRITETLPDPVPLLELSQVVGLLGGEIRIAGHTLAVPAGAVSVPTLFTVRALNNGYIEVELKAVVSGFLGRLINVGESGFRKPVTVELTYARGTNVTDPSRLKIMRLNDNGRHEVLPSRVDQNGRTVSAQLDHFSRYCMITD